MTTHTTKVSVHVTHIVCTVHQTGWACCSGYCCLKLCVSLLRCVPLSVPALLLSAGKEGIYDNPAMKRTPHAALKGMSGKGPEEDIYGEVGEGEAGIYDDTTGGGRGMKHSEDGIYDNPHAEGESRDLPDTCNACKLPACRVHQEELQQWVSVWSWLRVSLQ